MRNRVQRLAATHAPKPERIAVVICIDELLKIRDADRRAELLEALASAQQADLRAGLPTVIVVSSLRIFPLEAAWETASPRQMLAISLPPLEEKDHAEIAAKLIETYGAGTVIHDATSALCASLACTGGHPRLMEQLVRSFAGRSLGKACCTPFTFQCPRVTQLDPKHFDIAFTLLMLVRGKCRTAVAEALQVVHSLRLEVEARRETVFPRPVKASTSKHIHDSLPG